jgi:hypothetical protein
MTSRVVIWALFGVTLLWFAQWWLGVEGHAVRTGVLLSGAPLIAAFFLVSLVLTKAIFLVSPVCFALLFIYLASLETDKCKSRIKYMTVGILSLSTLYFLVRWGLEGMFSGIYLANILTCTALYFASTRITKLGVSQLFLLSIAVDLWFFSHAFPVHLL